MEPLSPEEQTAIIVMAVVLYVLSCFLPWMVAVYRDHPNQLAIFVLCLFLGWTCLGWVIALVWACTAVPSSYRSSYRYRGRPYRRW